jgi:tetratricopeptide (TPR) repeat protein
VYGGVDFTQGVDVSWWKNHPKPTSMFAFDSKEDFLAGYDHGRQAGTLHIADHATVPGKKFFAWGAGDEGRMWDKVLTDSDGPYLELMVGAWSDNQPDYSWVEPYEAKVVRQLWYPFQRIGGVKNANEDAAVNLEVKHAIARIGFVTTADYPAARVLLEAKGAVLLDDTVAIDPARPFVKEMRLPAGIVETDLRAALSVRGRELVAYRPIRVGNSPLPKPVSPPATPEQMKTNEELYLAALRLQQFHSPSSEPDPYYEEVIRRDPGDYRANTALGALDYRRGSFIKAEQRLQSAIERATKNYTSPRDGEALYYFGLVEKAVGNEEAAYESLYKATWSQAWHSAGFYQLAELTGLKGDFEKALEFANRSLSTNTSNGAALDLKAALLRKLGHSSEAEAVAATALALDPLDYRAVR